MNGMPRAEVISFSRPATSICNCSDSTTQGPEIRKKGLSSPTSKPQSFIAARASTGSARTGGRSRSCGNGFLVALNALRLVLERRLDVRLEERMAAPRRGLELGVELHAHEPW